MKAIQDHRKDHKRKWKVKQHASYLFHLVPGTVTIRASLLRFLGWVHMDVSEANRIPYVSL